LSKILWIGDGGCNTGFGRVAHAIGDRLVDKGHEVHVLATNYKGDPFGSGKMQLWPASLRNQQDTYGQRRIIELLNGIKPDVVFMLNDPQVLLQLIFENSHDPLKLLARHKIISYIPVDGYSMPSMYQPVFVGTNPIAMSKFGQEQIPGSRLVYHGVDTDEFWPVSSQTPITLSDGSILKTKAECKEAVGFPKDVFVVGRVDRNTGRKDYGALWKALQPVLKRHSDMLVYFHCKNREPSGVNMEALLSRDRDTMKQFRLPANFDPMYGLDVQDLNALMNSFDVFVSTSRGEGFGMTIAEALACGVPVIAQNVSAIPEVVGPGGELIDGAREITIPFGQDQWLADIGAFTEAIEHAYNSRGWRREKGKAGRNHVTSTFRWDAAADDIHEYIGEVLTHGQGPSSGDSA
jgi:glycosyltransferase involved in cell wall biosynthesis